MLRIAALAACIAVIVSAVMIVPMFRDDDATDIQDPDTTPVQNFDTTKENGTIIPIIPDVDVHISSSAPQYYGSENSLETLFNMMVIEDPSGLSVTAELLEVLPDTYVFFDDWHQCEFRLLRMKTHKLLKGQEMTEEFYYMIPVYYMTDFTPYHRFVILNMAQFGYEYSVMYNKTQSKAQRLNLVLFSYAYAHETTRGNLLCRNIMAFDEDGIFDKGLWNSSEAWSKQTSEITAVDTIVQAESAAGRKGLENEDRVQLLSCISGETARVISQIRSFDNGIFVPLSNSRKNFRYQDFVNLTAVRYINGFATNESVHVGSKSYFGGQQDQYSFTNARFTKEDMNALPDLTTAMASVMAEYHSGNIAPPHIIDYKNMNLQSYGIFGWYAKTASGVIGIVRVSWRYNDSQYKNYYDDAYYVVEYGSDECKYIDRDDLLECLGENEATYIYDGRYNEEGKMYMVAFYK